MLHCVILVNVSVCVESRPGKGRDWREGEEGEGCGEGKSICELIRPN